MWSCPSSSCSQVSWTIPGEKKKITHHHILVLNQESPGPRLGYPITHLGALEHIQGLYPPRYKTKDQPKRLSKDSLEHIQGPQSTSRDLYYQPPRKTSKDQSKHQARIPWNRSRGPRTHLGTYCFVLDQEPQKYTGGPHQGLLPWL